MKRIISTISAIAMLFALSLPMMSVAKAAEFFTIGTGGPTGFYLMPEFLNNKFKTSSEMCKDILNNTGIALLPGSDFGFNSDKMLARLSFTDFDGQEFMKNIDETKKIDENLINKFAPKVVEGVNKLRNWSETL